MSGLAITGALLGGLLSLVFFGYMVLSFSEKGHQTISRGPQKFAGLFSLVLGTTLLGFWFYFMITGRESLMQSFELLATHIVLEFLCAVSLLIAGIGAMRGWSRAPALLMTAIGILIFTTLLSLLAYGPIGHPFLMNGISIVVLVVFAYFIGLVYGWEHFVLHLDENKSTTTQEEEREKAA